VPTPSTTKAQQKAIQKADTLIEALGWIRRFRDTTTVIKLGGSLLGDPEDGRLRRWCDWLAGAGAGRSIVVAGGGPFADAVRASQAHWGFPDDVAHRMALRAMDQYALMAANLLVGNPAEAAGLEAVFLGPELLFHHDAVVAVCGADLPPKLDGAPAPLWESFAVKAGQTLGFEFLKTGARAYIAY
jgi:hypothetical protein